MSTATQGVTGIHYEELMKGVDDETRELVERMIVNFCNDEDQSAAEEKARSDKLRSAYNTLVDFLVNNKLNDLNPQQKVFLCTGAIGDLITVQAVKPPRELDLLPTHFYDMLIKIFSDPDPNARTLPVFSVLEKFILIAKTDLVALTFGDERKKALRNSPQDRKRAKDDVQRKLDAVRSEITLAAGQIDIYFPKLLAGMGEAAVKNVKNGLEMLKRVSAAWGKGDLAEEQEKNFQKSNEAKVGETGLSIAKWVDDVAQLLKLIRDNARMVDERYQAFQRLNIEVARIDSLSPTSIQRAGPLFNSDSISQIKVDIDTTNSSIVRAADSSAVKVPFSASRILLYKQFNDNEDFEVRFCSPPRVIASLEKILAIHVNLFPKDGQGRFIIPPILLEPLRNYVDFFQDRFIMGIVTGESERKGPFASFSPVDVQVLRLCGLFLSKDPIYDYRGDIKGGTFMGDYVGKIEKETSVKWTGKEKKFSLAVTQSMQDTASREDSVVDYIDFMSAMLNGTSPNPKLSKRKLNVLLKYVRFDKIEKNVAGLLKLVAQQEPALAKETMMFFTRDDVNMAKDMIRSAVASDPIAARAFSNNPEFAITRVFGVGPRKSDK